MISNRQLYIYACIHRYQIYVCACTFVYSVDNILSSGLPYESPLNLLIYFADEAEKMGGRLVTNIIAMDIAYIISSEKMLTCLRLSEEIQSYAYSIIEIIFIVAMDRDNWVMGCLII